MLTPDSACKKLQDANACLISVLESKAKEHSALSSWESQTAPPVSRESLCTFVMVQTKFYLSVKLFVLAVALARFHYAVARADMEQTAQTQPMMQ